MAITGEIKGDYQKKIGFGHFQVLGVNLSYEDLKHNGFYVKDDDLEKERHFITEKDGVESVQIEFALKEVGKKDGAYLKRISFFLSKEDVVSQKSGSSQFINDQGVCTYVDKVANLPEWFTKYGARKAKKGEEKFMGFMRSLMLIDFGKGGTLSYDISKLLDENFKEIRDDLKSEYVGTVIVPCTIKLKDVKSEDEAIETKEYESFFKSFAPGGKLGGELSKDVKMLNNKREWIEKDVDAIRQTIKDNKNKTRGEKTWLEPIQYVITEMTDGEYGCKELYSLSVLKNYNPAEHLAATNNTADISDDKDDY